MTGEGDEGKCSSASQHLMLVSRHSVVTLLIKNLDGRNRSGRLRVEAIKLMNENQTKVLIIITL